MWNKVTRVKCPVESVSNKHVRGIHHDLCKNWRCRGQTWQRYPQLGRLNPDRCIHHCKQWKGIWHASANYSRLHPRLTAKIKASLGATGYYSHNILGILLDCGLKPMSYAHYVPIHTENWAFSKPIRTSTRNSVPKYRSALKRPLWHQNRHLRQRWPWYRTW